MSSLKSNNILIACGGTGGHLFPGIAVAQTLKYRGYHPILLISRKTIDSLAVEKYPDLEFIPVPAIAMPPLFSLKTPVFALKLIQAILHARKIIHSRSISAVLGMGGFTSLPPVMAASQLGVPAFVHDSNALPGKANRHTARWCKSVLLGLPEAAKFFPGKPTLVTGTPVRAELQVLPDPASARKTLGLPPSPPAPPVVLVIGGSQGARNLNSQVIDTARSLDPSLCTFFLVTGPSDFERCSQLASGLPNVILKDFCRDMPEALAASSLAIARAGASTLTEFARAGLPSILVPYPFAADDHQTFNARAFTAAGAAYILPESSLSPQSLGSALTEFFSSPQSAAAMSAAARKLDTPYAAAAIADALIDSLQSQPR